MLTRNGRGLELSEGEASRTGGQATRTVSEARRSGTEAVVAKALRVYLAICALVAAASFVLPTSRALLAGVLGLLSVCAIVFAAVFRRPARARGWWLLAIAVGLMSVGGVLINAEASIYERP